MRASRARRRGLVLMAAGATGILVLLCWVLMRPGGWDGSDPVTVPDVPPSLAPGPGAGADAPSDGAAGRAGDTEDAESSEPPTTTGRSKSGTGPGWPGFTGQGMSAEVPSRTLRITVTSADPIGTVGWVVPTSRNGTHGTEKHVGRSWSMTTEVYGQPDYARVFLFAGPDGTSITCAIRVDGRVTERRATSGPYGQTMCQG